MYPVRSLGLRRLAKAQLLVLVVVPVLAASTTGGLISATGAVIATTGVGAGAGVGNGAVLLDLLLDTEVVRLVAAIKATADGDDDAIDVTNELPLPAVIPPIPPRNTSNNELPDEEEDVDAANDRCDTTGTGGCAGAATGTATGTATATTAAGGRGGTSERTFPKSDPKNDDDCDGDCDGDVGCGCRLALAAAKRATGLMGMALDCACADTRGACDGDGADCCCDCAWVC